MKYSTSAARVSGGFGAGDFVAALVALEPVFIDFLRFFIAVGAVEQNDAFAIFR